MNAEWLEACGLSWLAALECEGGFAEKVEAGVAIHGEPLTLATQARLGYCWSHLALLYPSRAEFGAAAEKSFRLLQSDEFTPNDADFRIYDQSFYLLFLAWYYRLTGDSSAMAIAMDRYTHIERHFDEGRAGGFVAQVPGVRSHNPYMHLLEAVMACLRSTRDDFWLGQARRIKQLFMTRLIDHDRKVVFEFLNADWSVFEEGRVEIGHQLEWPTLLLELSEVDGPAALTTMADGPYRFAMQYGFEDGLAIDAVKIDGTPIDTRKLLWVQMEAARHFAIRARILREDGARARAAEQWEIVLQEFFDSNGWTWYNSIASDGTPVVEPSFARLLYHVVSAAAECL